MPTIYLNRDALIENARLTKAHCTRFGCEWLPVLKMTQAWPSIRRLLQEEGIFRAGLADVDEGVRLHAAPDARRDVLINLASPDRADAIVRRFGRSVVSNREALAALEAAAARQRKPHDVLLAVDLGDGREGIPLAGNWKALLSEPRGFVRITGVCTTLGCLMGLCPDTRMVSALFERLEAVREQFDVDSPLVSLGGSIVWNWIVSHEAELSAIRFEHPGWTLELRAGNPLMIGWDDYRDEPLLSALEGAFRSDVFVLGARVLELQRKTHSGLGEHVLNGHGARLQPQREAHCQAIADCGRLHTDVSSLRLLLPKARIIDFSGNYCIMDVTECRPLPKPGDRIAFMPSYWAVAWACRTPCVEKKIVSNQEFQELIRCAS